MCAKGRSLSYMYSRQKLRNCNKITETNVITVSSAKWKRFFTSVSPVSDDDFPPEAGRKKTSLAVAAHEKSSNVMLIRWPGSARRCQGACAVPHPVSAATRLARMPRDCVIWIGFPVWQTCFLGAITASHTRRHLMTGAISSSARNTELRRPRQRHQLTLPGLRFSSTKYHITVPTKVVDFVQNWELLPLLITSLKCILSHEMQ